MSASRLDSLFIKMGSSYRVISGVPVFDVLEELILCIPSYIDKSIDDKLKEIENQNRNPN